MTLNANVIRYRSGNIVSLVMGGWSTPICKNDGHSTASWASPNYFAPNARALLCCLHTSSYLSSFC